MERKDRPVSRKKNVVEGSAHAGRREGGPVGGPKASSFPGASGRPSAPITGQGSGAGRNTGTPTPFAGQTSGSGRSTGAGQTRSGSSLLTLIIIVAVLLLGGGGGLGAITGLFGGDSGASDLIPDNTVINTVTATPKPATPKPATPVPTAVPNNSVSAGARDKRVALKGDGSDTTTILVYMCGTDLESKGGYATKDLQEMTSARLGSNVTLLVYTGGCRSWKNSVVSSSKNQIYQVRDGGLALVWESNKLSPMTDPGTLSSFIQWGKQNAPADRYELIFWDHGGGSVSGYGYDEACSGSGSMTLDGIAKALQDGGCTFDFIGFDACLMATLETALVAEPYADYLIASEETEPGCGWYYTDWLTRLSNDPSRTALEMGTDIASDFVNVCGQVASGQQATLSVIDLAELAGTVPERFQAFALSTARNIKENNYQSVANARANTKEFAKSNHIDQVDLIHLANNMGTAEGKQLAAALKGAVKYNATSRNISNANGVSIYFPYGRTSNVNKMASTYDKIGLDSSYTECIKDFASVEVAGQSAFGGSSSQLESLFGALMGGGSPTGGSSSGMLDGSAVADLLGVLLGGRNLPEVGLNDETAGFLNRELIEDSAASLAYNQLGKAGLAWSEKDGQQVLCLPEEQWALIQSVELNVFADDGEGYLDLGLDNVFDFNDDGDLIGEYDGTWLSVNGQVVAYYAISGEGADDDYTIMGYIPARLNGQRVDLIVSFTDEIPDGEILGAAIRYDEETETATLAKGLLPIEDGDVIDFVCDYYDYQKNFRDTYYMGDPLVVNGELKLANIPLDNTGFVAAYRLTDLYHNHVWTPAIK